MLSRIALALLLCTPAACARTVDTTMQDAALTAAVVTALLNNTTIDGTLIAVRTAGGVVHLEGVQPTDADAAQAVAIARSVQGVRDVQARITVDPAVRAEAPPAAPPE